MSEKRARARRRRGDVAPRETTGPSSVSERARADAPRRDRGAGRSAAGARARGIFSFYGCTQRRGVRRRLVHLRRP